MSDSIIAVIGLHKDLNAAGQDLSRVATLNINHQLAEKIATSTVISKGGKVIGEIRGSLIVDIPMTEAECLRDIQEQIAERCRIYPTIGVGSDMSEAEASYKFAEENTPGHIKVYDHEVMESERFNHEQSFVATSPDDQVRKAEGDDDFTPISPEEKLKVKLALESIRRNGQLFEQMKQQAPQVYAGIVGIINSLQLIFQEEKIRKDQKISEIIQNLAAEIQRKRDERNNHDRTDIIRNLDIDNQLNEENQLEDFHAKKNEQSVKDKQSRVNAKKYAQKIGHSNPEFFHRLARAFKVE